MIDQKDLEEIKETVTTDEEKAQKEKEYKENAEAFLKEHQESCKKYGLQFSSQVVVIPYTAPTPEPTPETAPEA